MSVTDEQGEPEGVELASVTRLEAEGRVWAMREELVVALMSLEDTLISPALLEASMKSVAAVPQRAQGGAIAILPLRGIIQPQPSFLSMLFGDGGGGLTSFSKQLSAAVADPDVSHIVLNVDSPGGVTDLVPEVGAQIREAREQKPIVAVANTMAASAAYWLASQANEVVASPSSLVGSIGVYQTHHDTSEARRAMGVKTTLVSAGKYKTEGNPYEPLDPEAYAAAQQMVDDFYDQFTKAVADGRGVSQDDVKSGYGEGRVLTAERARKAGLVDRVATLDETVRRLASGRARVRRSGDAQAEVETEPTSSFEPVGEIAYTAEEKSRLLAVLAGAA